MRYVVINLTTKNFATFHTGKVWSKTTALARSDHEVNLRKHENDSLQRTNSRVDTNYNRNHPKYHLMRILQICAQIECHQKQGEE